MKKKKSSHLIWRLCVQVENIWRTQQVFLNENILVLENGLKTNFAEASVQIVDCPDLSQCPFHLAAPGLGGDGTIVEFGGPPYLLPLVDKSKVYDLVPLLRNIGGYHSKEFFTCGGNEAIRNNLHF